MQNIAILTGCGFSTKNLGSLLFANINENCSDTINIVP